MNHGGNLHDAKALFPEAPEPWIDLSTGINPTAYPLSLGLADSFTRLPSWQAVQNLEQAAARAYGVMESGRIVAAPGSQALIELLPRLRSKSRVAILGPTYNEHTACWHREGHVCAAVETLSEALSTTPDVIVVVNPNNPDGRVVSAADLEQAAAVLAKRKGWLVVDEAFADLEDGVSLAHRNLPATIILRSFGKTYGLAGIRLGFALAPNDFTNTIRDHLGLWAVSGPALEIGAKALVDQGWIETQQRLLRDAARDLDSLLESCGFGIVGGTLLFRLARHSDACLLFERLARAGIWVRKFPHDTTILRFGIPPRSAFERLRTALTQEASA